MAMSALNNAAKHSKFMKFILGGFIFLAVGGLVFTDVNGYFRGGLPNNTVARVDDREISLAEFDNGLRKTLQQLQIMPDQAYQAGLVHAFLQARIDFILQNKANADLNIEVSDQIIAQELKATFGNLSKDEIESIIRARGISEKDLAASIRDQIKLSIYENLPKGIENFTPSSVSQALSKAENEQRTGVIYSFPANKLVDSIEITDEDIQPYYETMKDTYRVPSSRQFIIGTFEPKDIPASAKKVTGEDIQSYYDENIDDFTVPEKRKISQAVVKNADQAQAIYELATNNTDLDKAVADVTGNNNAYRKAENYESDGLPDELSELAFSNSASKGSVLAPVQTLVGWHVMVIEDIIQPTTKPLSSVQDEIKTIVADQKLYDTLYNKMTMTEDLIDSGADFATIKKETGLTTTTTKAISEDDVELPAEIQNLVDDTPSIRDEIFALDEGMASYPVELENGGYVIIGAQNIKPVSFTPLDNVKSDIEKEIRKQRINSQAEAVLADLMTDFDPQSLTETYAPRKTYFKNVTMDGTNANADIIFKTPYNKPSGYIKNDRVYIVNVNAVQYPSQDKGTDINYSEMLDGVFTSFYRKKADIMINEALLKERYGN